MYKLGNKTSISNNITLDMVIQFSNSSQDINLLYPDEKYAKKICLRVE